PATPAAAPEPPPPAGPPITAAIVGSRVILKIPAERFDLDAMAALGKKQVELLRPTDDVSGKLKDRIHAEGCGFLAPLAFLSEVFIDGRPLDRKRFDAESKEMAPGARALEAHLPRFGPVRVIDLGGKRWVTSELDAPAAELLALI